MPLYQTQLSAFVLAVALLLSVGCAAHEAALAKQAIEHVAEQNVDGLNDLGVEYNRAVQIVERWPIELHPDELRFTQESVMLRDYARIYRHSNLPITVSVVLMRRGSDRSLYVDDVVINDRR